MTDADRSKIIDNNKLRRERIKVRKQLQDGGNQSVNDVISIYFDGRKDHTLIRNKQDDKWLICIKKEEHYVLVSEPGGKYIPPGSDTST